MSQLAERGIRGPPETHHCLLVACECASSPPVVGLGHRRLSLCLLTVSAGCCGEGSASSSWSLVRCDLAVVLFATAPRSRGYPSCGRLSAWPSCNLGPFHWLPVGDSPWALLDTA